MTKRFQIKPVRMSWEKLLSDGRYNSSPRPSKDRSEFQEDYDNLVFSTAFRRMQGKTQVFPLSGSDYVRTRLTHTLEVSCVGRALGQMVGHNIELPENRTPEDLGAIVAAACLAHDVGNPPFGHSGEAAIREWFARSHVAKALKKELNAQEKRDVSCFDGNAQGFRVVTKLQKQGNGLELTFATLAAMTKYPNAALAGTVKFGFFNSELAAFETVAKETGLLRNGEGQWQRHPLAYLVEAADDICNRVIDLQDSARLGLLNSKEVNEHFGAVLEEDIEAHARRAENEVWGCKVLKLLSREIAENFVSNEERLLTGKYLHPTIIPVRRTAQLDEILDLLKKRVFSRKQVIEVEVPGFRVLGGLLDALVNASEECHLRKAPSKQNQLLLKFIPAQFRKFNKDTTAYTRLLGILDFVSGMTDSYAVSLYQTITGMALPRIT